MADGVIVSFMLMIVYKVVLYACVVWTLVHVGRTYFRAGLFPRGFPAPDSPRVWLAAGIVVVTICLCLWLDPAVKERFQAARSAGLTPLFKAFNLLGDGNVLYAILFVCFLSSRLLGFRRVERLFGLSLFSAVAAGLVVQVFQNLTLRARPFASESAVDFFNYSTVIAKKLMTSVRYKSFPSGHTVNIFAAVMPFVLTWRRWWTGLPLLGAALMTGLARIYFNKHWLSDVFTAAVVAGLVGWILWRAANAGQSERKIQKGGA